MILVEVIRFNIVLVFIELSYKRKRVEYRRLGTLLRRYNRVRFVFDSLFKFCGGRILLKE